MPGYADWEQLYEKELFQLKEEGYDVSGAHVYTDAEISYHELWKIHGTELRRDYPYTEPNEYDEIIDASADLPKLKPLDDKQYNERISGAVYGRIAGIVLGKPLEMGFDMNTVKSYLQGAEAYPLNDFVPAKSEGSGMTARNDCIFSTKGNISFVQPDDDVNYTLLALLLAERYGIDFTPENVGANWLDNIPYHWVWCASRQAYYHLVNSVEPRQIPTLLNPWRECIDGQIRSDLWGYISPANPRRAALGAYRDCSLSLVKNGIYGGMFTAGCISAALSVEPDVEKIIMGGLSVTPKKSRLAEMVEKVTKWYSQDSDYEKVCVKIYSEWGHLPFAATINNMAIVTLALLHGNLDYTKTITTAVMCGLDTDCNSGTAGSIVGAAIGFDKIEKRWYIDFNDTIKSVVASVGEIKITELIKRIIKCRISDD
ncbi:MAG: ADP-ribosylglycohydrolase family protein [Eubacteriales bacterium]|jgi:hypothetical protein